MNEKLLKEIKIELGVDSTDASEYVAARRALCHPTHDDSDDICVTNDEEMVNSDVLKTPIECGSHAYIYRGYAQLGGVSDDGSKVFISGEGLKTPGRAEAANALLAFAGQSLDPKTWVYTAGKESVYVGDEGVLVSESGIEGEHEDTVSGISDGKLKFYVEYIIEMLTGYDGRPDAAFLGAADAGYQIRGAGQDYSNIEDMVNSLIIPEALVMDALELRGLSKTRTITGRAIWTLKQDMQNIVKAVRGQPTQFKA